MRTVFLSSTSKDLAKYREAVITAIDGLDGYKCIRMENFGARDWEADAFCRQQVASADVFACIVGLLYGSCPTSSTQSYTEREFDQAVAANKPRLIYFAPDDLPLPGNLRNTDEEHQKQQTFRQKANNGRIRDSFTSPEDLATRVVRDIRNWENEQRNESTPPRQDLRPFPPQPCFAHSYPLQKNFTGRIRERQMLTEWLTASDKTVFAFIAIGGMGKSALTWAWVQRDVLGEALPSAAPDGAADPARCRVPEDQRPAGVFWWSFYEREANFASFIKQALVYASQGAIKLDEVPSTAEQVRALVPLLRKQRLLLVLDGFERELRAYASLSAAYQGDAVTEDAHGDYRAATSQPVAWFLQAIGAQALKSRVLLTSRLLPRELDGLAGCEQRNLDSLDPADAVVFFHSQGVRGTRVEIGEACQPYGYHPLALRLLAGVILKDKRNPGDIQVAEHYLLLSDSEGEKLQRILQIAYDHLETQERKLLSQIATFRNPMTYDALYQTIGKNGHYTSTKEFDYALDDLMQRGWLFGGVFQNEKKVRYYLHPVAQQYARNRLIDKEGAHAQLIDYFASAPFPDGEGVRSAADLEMVIELYHHTVNAGQFTSAQAIFTDRLRYHLLHSLSEYQLCLELLGALFTGGEGRLPRTNRTKTLVTMNSMLELVYDLALCHSRCGRPARSVSILEGILSFSVDVMGTERVTSVASIPERMLSKNLLDLGCIREAELHLQKALKLLKGDFGDNAELGEENAINQQHGILYCKQGKFNEAIDKLYANAGFHIVQPLLATNIKLALAQAYMALESWNEPARRYNVTESDFVEIKWLLGLSLISYVHVNKEELHTQLIEAEAHLTEALTCCRRINLVELESDILLAWARLHHARGDIAQALKDAEESLAIADRCEYRLKQAELYNFFAQMAAEASYPQAAIRHAQRAYERAWCDGPPYCYKPALEEAEKMLKQLGAQPPSIK